MTPFNRTDGFADPTLEALVEGVTDLVAKVSVQELSIEVTSVTITCNRLARYYPDGCIINTHLGATRVEFVKS